jgi:hypothetical protein
MGDRLTSGLAQARAWLVRALVGENQPLCFVSSVVKLPPAPTRRDVVCNAWATEQQCEHEENKVENEIKTNKKCNFAN